MTEKRFNCKKDDNNQCTISDNLNQYPMPIMSLEQCRVVAYALNGLWEQTKRFEKGNARYLEENEQLKKQLKELNSYCTACDDTLTTIQELTYKLLTVDFKDTETKADYCHLLNELDNKDLSFIHDCIKAINKCDIIGMTQLIREC